MSVCLVKRKYMVAYTLWIRQWWNGLFMYSNWVSIDIHIMRIDGCKGGRVAMGTRIAPADNSCLIIIVMTDDRTCARIRCIHILIITMNTNVWLANYRETSCFCKPIINEPGKWHEGYTWHKKINRDYRTYIRLKKKDNNKPKTK